MEETAEHVTISVKRADLHLLLHGAAQYARLLDNANELPLFATRTRGAIQRTHYQMEEGVSIGATMTYEERVEQLELEGCTTSDAQSVADCEVDKGTIQPPTSRR